MKRFTTEVLILVSIGAVVSLLFKFLIYPAIGLMPDGPIPVRTIILVLVATVFIKRSGKSWSDYGLHWPFRWYHLILATLALFLIKLLGIQQFNDWLKGILSIAPNDYSFFGHIHQSIPALIVWLAIAWFAGGFGEEMLLRGYFMQRMAEVLGSSKSAWGIAIFTQAALFGLGHIYANPGAVLSGVIGALVYGTFAVLMRKSIWPIIIVHGTWDTLGVLQFYLEGIPN